MSNVSADPRLVSACALEPVRKEGVSPSPLEGLAQARESSSPKTGPVCHRRTADMVLLLA
uniref:Uncharacterized protein n=1 Tax=Pyxidicoccus parkwayensis TaxID=2813578 RepID=A0ABX7NVB9_9BACT|nr:hypothetical protein [Pyxidicoccus parkwaysis]QSQ22814.1 hypothetical protein JY651_48285 [Pyxidicoccus parkwaysis]